MPAEFKKYCKHCGKEPAPSDYCGCGDDIQDLAVETLTKRTKLLEKDLEASQNALHSEIGRYVQLNANFDMEQARITRLEKALRGCMAGLKILDRNRKHEGISEGVDMLLAAGEAAFITAPQIDDPNTCCKGPIHEGCELDKAFKALVSYDPSKEIEDGSDSG